MARLCRNATDDHQGRRVAISYSHHVRVRQLKNRRHATIGRPESGDPTHNGVARQANGRAHHRPCSEVGRCVSGMVSEANFKRTLSLMRTFAAEMSFNPESGRQLLAVF